MNDEARMTKDEADCAATFRHLFVCHSFERCHSSHVIL
jgi:hypothetical protein